MVDVFELARTGAVAQGEVALASMERLRTSLREASGSIAYRFTGRIDSLGRPAAVLHLRGELPSTCDRCGQAVAVPLDHRAAFHFVRDIDELNNLPVTPDEDPEPLVGSIQFNLPGLVEDEVILCVPLSPRHDKCPGQEAGDPVAATSRANPFAVLKGALRKNGH